MKFREHDIVRILKDCDGNVKIGEIGAVLMVFDTPKEAYEVEVLDEMGRQKAQCTLLPSELELVDI